MLCVGCILHDKGAPGGGVGVKGGDWYLAIVGCCQAAGAADYDSSCPSPAQEQPPPHRRSFARSLKTMTCSVRAAEERGATADLCRKCRRIAHHYYPFHCDN